MLEDIRYIRMNEVITLFFMPHPLSLQILTYNFLLSLENLCPIEV